MPNKMRGLTRLLLLLAILLSACNLNTSSQNNAVTVSGEPQVRIVSPLPNATYLEGVTVNIQAIVSNAGADIDRVEVVVDGGMVATLPQPNSSGAASFSVTHGWSAAGVGAHTIDVTAFRADGSSSAPAPVNLTVVNRNTQIEPTATTQQFTLPTVTPRGGSEATATGGTDPTETSGTPSVPTITVLDNPNNGINVRRGPSTQFDRLGQMQEGQSAEALALNTAGDWYKIRYGSGEGWVFGELVAPSGDVASLPRESGPPLPTVLPTAIPLPTVTVAPQTSANLVAGIVELQPAQPTCAQTINIGFDVANLGSQATGASGTVSVQDVRTSDGSVQGTTVGGFPIIQPGQTFRVTMALTISTYYGEGHRIILIIDQGNAIPETVETDNRREVEYTLDRGSCP